jgi:hypothetical protein
MAKRAADVALGGEVKAPDAGLRGPAVARHLATLSVRRARRCRRETRAAA